MYRSGKSFCLLMNRACANEKLWCEKTGHQHTRVRRAEGVAPWIRLNTREK